MRCVVEVAIAPPRTISAPSGWAGRAFLPFIEITARAEIGLAEWDVSEAVWLHWAAPAASGSIQPSAARRFDPGRRAAAPGEPMAGLRGGGACPSAAEMAALGVAVTQGWRCELHRHGRLGLVSRLDEPLGDFVRRCRALVGAALRASSLPQEATTAELRRVEVETESRTLGHEHLRVLSMEARIAWYPEGAEPDPATDSLMVRGEPRGAR